MFETQRYEEVMSITVDNFCDENGVIPDLVKIDVQGLELNVLKGMKKTLEKSRPFMFVEHNCYTLSQNKTFIQDLVDFIKKYDYFLYDIDTGKEYKSYFGNRDLVMYIPEEKIEEVKELLL